METARLIRSKIPFGLRAASTATMMPSISDTTSV